MEAWLSEVLPSVKQSYLQHGVRGNGMHLGPVLPVNACQEEAWQAPQSCLLHGLPGQTGPLHAQMNSQEGSGISTTDMSQTHARALTSPQITDDKYEHIKAHGIRAISGQPIPST